MTRTTSRLVAGVAALATATASVRGAEITPPEYCSLASQMEARGIPPPSWGEGEQYTLAAVTTVIRHGARTPTKAPVCWGPSYDSKFDWGDCDANGVEVVRPSTESAAPGTVFEVRAGDDGNLLTGSCKLGMLIKAGFEQQAANGRHLREAYVGAEARVAPLVAEGETLSPSELYFRSSDIERTILSGQTLAVNFLADELPAGRLPWVAPESSLDWIYANAARCPKLGEEQEAIYSGDEYRAWVNSPDVMDVKVGFTDAVGGQYPWGDLEGATLDCLATTACTEGIDFPPAVDQSMFSNAFGLVQAREAFKFTYAEGKWSKLAMAPLMHEITEGLMAISEAQTAEGGAGAGPRYRLYSAHDTTINPLMAALQGDVWDGSWAPYASMFNIELWRPTATATAMDMLRFVFNGRVVHPEGCPTDQELCPLQAFIGEVSSWATPMSVWKQQCEPKDHDHPSFTGPYMSANDEHANKGKTAKSVPKPTLDPSVVEHCHNEAETSEATLPVPYTCDQLAQAGYCGSYLCPDCNGHQPGQCDLSCGYCTGKLVADEPWQAVAPSKQDAGSGVAWGWWMLTFLLGLALGDRRILTCIAKGVAGPDRQGGEGGLGLRVEGASYASGVYAQAQGVEMGLRGSRRGYTQVPEVREHVVQPPAVTGIQLP